MKKTVGDRILEATGAATAAPVGVVQRLWSGYGEIVRYALKGGDRDSVVVKHVRPGRVARDAADALSHRRKLRSYRVESAWYARWSERCDESCRVPACLACASFGDETLLVLEDLDAAGFPGRRASLGEDGLHLCLRWLANFHAAFMGERPKELWPTGTYWHLATRPDEWRALQDGALKNAAAAIDRALSASPWQTLAHGDAKLANFCFSRDGRRVAAVDFQYVGGGCGMKDVAYFMDSCMDASDCARLERRLLDGYFRALREALTARGKAVDFEALEADWRALYPLAWADFYRFLKGWSPGLSDSNAYGERLAQAAAARWQTLGE